MTGYVAYVQYFCRFAIIITFFTSFTGKIRSIPKFEKAITDFDLTPQSLNRILVFLFLLGELVTVVLLFLGGIWSSLGFILAITHLVLFSGALILVIARNIQTSCNCFGSSEKTVSYYDVWRNGGLITCASIGLATLNADLSLHLSIPEMGIIFLMTIPFVAVWIHLGDLIQLFR